MMAGGKSAQQANIVTTRRTAYCHSSVIKIPPFQNYGPTL